MLFDRFCQWTERWSSRALDQCHKNALKTHHDIPESEIRTISLGIEEDIVALQILADEAAVFCLDDEFPIMAFDGRQSEGEFLIDTIPNLCMPFDEMAMERGKNLSLVRRDGDRFFFAVVMRSTPEEAFGQDAKLYGIVGECITIATARFDVIDGKIKVSPGTNVKYVLDTKYDKVSSSPLDPNLHRDIALLLGRWFAERIEWITKINAPSNWIIERTNEKARPVKKGAIPRSDQRPRYIILSDKEMKRKIRIPSGESEKIERAAHRRRAHLALLKSERYRHKRGQYVKVKACWVGPQEYREHGEIYKVLIDK